MGMFGGPNSQGSRHFVPVVWHAAVFDPRFGTQDTWEALLHASPAPGAPPTPTPQQIVPSPAWGPGLVGCSRLVIHQTLPWHRPPLPVRSPLAGFSLYPWWARPALNAAGGWLAWPVPLPLPRWPLQRNSPARRMAASYKRKGACAPHGTTVFRKPCEMRLWESKQGWHGALSQKGSS